MRTFSRIVIKSETKKQLRTDVVGWIDTEYMQVQMSQR